MLNISVKSSNAVELIILDGEIDMYVAPQVRAALLAASKACSKGVAVDLGGVSYMDSSGIATLIEGLQMTKKKGARFLIFGVQPNVMDMLKLAKLHDFFELYPSENDALNSLC